MNRIPMKRVKGLVALWSIIIAVSAYEIHNNLVEQECNEQFRSALIARASANEAADDFTGDQLRATIDWVSDFTHGAEHPYGPERLQWVNGVGQRALARFHDLDAKRDQALTDRRSHPIPELTCGQ